MKKYFKKLDSEFKDLFKGFSLNLIFYVLNLVIVYFLAILITKYYGPATYGRYSIIKSLILILIIFNTLGLNTNAIKLSAHKDYFFNGIYKTDFFKKSYLLLICTSVIFTFLLLFFKSEIVFFVFKDPELMVYLNFFPLILLFSVFLNFNSNVLKGQGKILSFSVISSFLNNFTFILLLFLFFNFYSKNESFLVLSLLISFIIAFISSLFKIFPLRFSKPIKKEKYSKLLKDSLPMMLSSSMIFIIFSIDTLMIGFFESSNNVGVYRIVTQISGINAIFLIIFGAIVGPKISNYFSQNKDFKIKKLIVRSSKIIFFITIPFLFLILLFSNEILNFFGEDYLIGKNAIIILSVSQFIYSITGFVDLILNMTGKQNVFGKITILGAVINITLNLILIPKFSITGAAIATGFSILLTNLFAIIYIYRKYNYLPFYIPFKKY